VERHTLFAMKSIVLLGLWACSRPPDNPAPHTVGTSTLSAFDSSAAADESSAIAVDAEVITAIVSALDSCTSIVSHGSDSARQPPGSLGKRRWSGSVRSFGYFTLFLPDSARILELNRTAGALRVDWPMCSDYCHFGVSVYADSGVDLNSRVARLVAEQRRIDSVNRDPRAEAMEFDEINGPPRPVMTPTGRAYVIDHSCGDCAASTLRFGRSGKIADVSLSADAMPGAGRRMCEMMVVARSFAWEP
jgi:hypothetical protein